jgi:hypothetical protein
VLGLGLGITSGIAVSRIAVSSMAHTDTGGELIPPFVMVTNWVPSAAIMLLVAGVGVLILSGALRAYSRLPVHYLARSRD